MPESTCTHDGCNSPCFCRSWCTKHYRRWYKANRDQASSKNPGAQCAIDGCRKPARARGWCPMHYSRWKKHGDPLVVRHKHDGHIPQPCSREGCEQRNYARGLCRQHYNAAPDQQAKAKQHRARPDVRARRREQDRDRAATRSEYKITWQRRKAWPRWAAEWEDRRRLEDLEELSERAAQRQRRIARATRPLPGPRRWVAGQCLACAEPWVDCQGRKPSGYCKRCQDRRWAADSRHKRRAWKLSAAVVEVVSPDVVFRRDAYRCQICKRKTHGTVPALTAPTLDHIVPLKHGGEHSYRNTQCACFSCNCRKGAHAANDQLRLLA